MAKDSRDKVITTEAVLPCWVQFVDQADIDFRCPGEMAYSYSHRNVIMWGFMECCVSIFMTKGNFAHHYWSMNIVREPVGGFGGLVGLSWGKQINYVKLFIGPLASRKCMLAVWNIAVTVVFQDWNKRPLFLPKGAFLHNEKKSYIHDNWYMWIFTCITLLDFIGRL